MQSLYIPVGIFLVIIVPLIAAFFMGSDLTYGPLTEEEWEKVDPDLFVNGWTYWFIKKVIVLICLLLVALILLYVFQEKLLYLPGTPIQLIERNPEKYRSPEERGMKFEEIWITSKDGTKL